MHEFKEAFEESFKGLQGALDTMSALLQRQTDALATQAIASNKIAESFQTIVRDFLVKQNGQLPPDMMRITDHEKIIDGVLGSKSKWENKLLALTGSIVAACLVTMSVNSARSSDKAGEVAVATAKTVAAEISKTEAIK